LLEFAHFTLAISTMKALLASGTNWGNSQIFLALSNMLDGAVCIASRAVRTGAIMFNSTFRVILLEWKLEWE
jgi:hypothetical protein